jgi:predicted DNA binding protein
MSIDDIAEEIGLDANTVYEVLKKHKKIKN